MEKLLRLRRMTASRGYIRRANTSTTPLVATLEEGQYAVSRMAHISCTPSHSFPQHLHPQWEQRAVQMQHRAMHPAPQHLQPRGCCATIKNRRLATISDTSHGRRYFARCYASQVRSRRRRWPERPDFTGETPCETIGGTMQPPIGLSRRGPST